MTEDTAAVVVAVAVRDAGGMLDGKNVFGAFVGVATTTVPTIGTMICVDVVGLVDVGAGTLVAVFVGAVVGVLVGVFVAVGVAVSVGVAFPPEPLTWVAVGVRVAVVGGGTDGVLVGVHTGITVFVGVIVGVTVGVFVAALVGVFVGGTGVCVGVKVGRTGMPICALMLALAPLADAVGGRLQASGVGVGVGASCVLSITPIPFRHPIHSVGAIALPAESTVTSILQSGNGRTDAPFWPGNESYRFMHRNAPSLFKAQILSR